MSLQWFPGHMARARRDLRAYAEKAGIFLHVLDARAPGSTLYPAILPGRKPVLVFAKSDLADPAQTDRWRKHLESQGYAVVSSTRIMKENFWKSAPPSARVVVAGLPNVGKSTLINRMAGGKKARTGATPGVTRGPQWIKLNVASKTVYLLDTPGIFYPESLPEERGWRLAAIGTVPEKNYASHFIWIAEKLIRFAQARYGLFADEPDNFAAFLEKFGRERGLLLKGGAVDVERGAYQLILDFQKGKWGRLTLESPPERITMKPTRGFQGAPRPDGK